MMAAFLFSVIAVFALVGVFTSSARADSKAPGADEPVYEELGAAPIEDFVIAPLVFPEENESELIAGAVISSLGTEYEKECWGFDATELIRIVANEGGEDFDVCWAVATACFNTQTKYNSRFDPIEVCTLYKYDTVQRKNSDLALFAARMAVIDVYVHGNMCDEIQNATVFYSPALASSAYHESQKFICEIHGVRFFEEW